MTVDAFAEVAPDVFSEADGATFVYAGRDATERGPWLYRRQEEVGEEAQHAAWTPEGP